MSKRSRMTLIVAIVALAGVAGIWLAMSMTPHKHELVRMTDEQGKVYYTCPMHPQVKQGEPGNCPICGMKLVKVEETSSPAQAGGEKKILYWYDPMKPEAHFDKPGKSPFMDMELVPRYADEGAGEMAGGEGVGVRIDPRVVQNLGIRTTTVKRGTFFQRIDAVGSVEIDERRIVAIESRAAGWVEALWVRSLGEQVTRGQRLAGVYSADLYAAQQELVLAVKSGDAALTSAARQRLSLLGLSAGQIDAVARDRKAQRQALILSPAEGVVTELNVREGQQVMPGTPLMLIADLSRVWVTVELPEAQGSWIVEGRQAQAQLPAVPGTTFEGTVEYVYPSLATQTRTVRARIAFDNPRLALKPGMFADVALFGGPRQNVLLVPSEAVIRTGERTVVILAEGDGRFRPAIVGVGAERGGETEILRGLVEGETIVVSGQFLIDSEANLRGALARMAPTHPVPLPPDGESQAPGPAR